MQDLGSDMGTDRTFGSFDRARTQAEAIEERIASSTVGIVARSEQGVPGQGLGSGALVSHRDRLLIITAAHVISNTPTDELRFFLRSGGALRRSSYEDRALGGVAPARQIPISGRKLDEVNDLAALELGCLPDALRPSVPFEQLEDCAGPSETQLVAFSGYPSSTGAIVSRDSAAACECLLWSTVESGSGIRDFDPMRLFVIDYKAEVSAGFHPAGFSGAAVWSQVDEGALWTPNTRLVGVVQSYYRDRELLECIRVEVVKAFLAG